MVLRRHSVISDNRKGGFALIEVTVVLSLIALFAGFTLFVSMDGYREYRFQSDRDTLITALHHARSQSMANVCLDTGSHDLCSDGRGKAHGVALHPSGAATYVVFQVANPLRPEDGYAGRDGAVDAIFEGSPTVSVSGLDEVVFTQLSGNAPSSQGDIVIRDGIQESTITIGAEGQITWTH